MFKFEPTCRGFMRAEFEDANGEVTWQGEENSDMGKIVIKDNKVTIKKAKVTWE